MSNPHRGHVEIDIGGVTRILRYDMNAFAELEKELGKSFHEIFKKNGDDGEEYKIGFHVVREVIWAGLRWQNKKLKPEDVGKMMDLGDFKYYGTKLQEALSLALGGGEEKGKGAKESDPLEQTESTGESS